MRNVETDTYGRARKVPEDPGGLDYDTTYGYDVLNNLTSVMQGSESRSFNFDSYSRLISASSPETGPSMAANGTKTYGCDDKPI